MARAKSPAKKFTKKPAPKTSKKSEKKTTKVKLLTGGNSQIAKSDGDEAVQQYISAMPGWKSAVGKQLDLIIAKNVLMLSC